MVLADGKEVRSAGFARYETVPAALAGMGWPNGASVSMALQQNPNYRERPYMAVWVENAKGDLVTTLAEWGSNQKYVSSLSNWMRQVAGEPNFRAMTRATRPAGQYTLVWDGKDSKGKVVPKGTYKIFVEASYEHSGHSISSTTIVCGEKDAKAVARGHSILRMCRWFML